MNTNTQNFIIAVVIAATIIGASAYVALQPSATSGITLLPGQEFLQKQQTTPESTIIDVRTPAEYAAGHIDGAINIDMQDPTFTEHLQKLDVSKPYFVYCHSGRRSAIATQAMRSLGFTKLYELSGGLSGNSGIPLVTR